MTDVVKKLECLLSVTMDMSLPPKGVHEVESDGLYVRLDDYYDKIYTPYNELCDACWRELRENSIEAIEKIFSKPAK